jgi:nucleotide-binding universal stress UspA family protein
MLIFITYEVLFDRVMDKILVPVDDSPQATAALEYALDVFADAAITALHVIQLPEGYWSWMMEEDDDMPRYEEMKEKAEGVLEAAVAEAADDHKQIETVVKMGRPDREIVTYADENGFDQIVIGSHGRHEASRILFGSVSEKVARRSPLSVTIVRKGKSS